MARHIITADKLVPMRAALGCYLQQSQETNAASICTVLNHPKYSDVEKNEKADQFRKEFEFELFYYNQLLDCSELLRNKKYEGFTDLLKDDQSDRKNLLEIWKKSGELTFTQFFRLIGIFGKNTPADGGRITFDDTFITMHAIIKARVEAAMAGREYFYGLHQSIEADPDSHCCPRL